MKCKIAGKIYEVFDIVRSKRGRLWVKTLCIFDKDPFMKQFSCVPDDNNYVYYVPLSDVTEFLYEPMSKEETEQQPINIANDPLNGFCRAALNTSATLETPIDWEQRRYEIAKSAMVGRLTSPVIEGFDPNPTMPDVCKWSIKFADTLIDELKKQNNG